MYNVMYDLKIQVSASNTMAAFLDFINYSALVDLELEGGGASLGLVVVKLLLVLVWTAS